MATDVERLVVSLEATITKYERAMNKAMQQTNKTARNMENRFNRAAGTVESRFARMGRGMSTSFAALQVGWAKAFAGVAALRGAQQLIDASTRIENSLKVAGLAGDELVRVYDSLYASAQRNAAPVESLVELYGRAAQVQNELGVSSEELLGFTDNIAVALRVSGKSASEASGALLQLSQALGSGIVRAEEFNSINEGALPVLQAVAAGMQQAGGSVSRLRQLVIDGKVSSEAFFRAFEAGSVILNEKVADAELTISQQFIRLQNVLIDTAGKFSEATGAGDLMGAAIARLADDIDDFGDFLDEHGESVRSFFQAIADGLDAIDRHGGVLADLMGRGEWNAFGYVSGLAEGFQGLAMDVGTVEEQIASLTAQLLANQNLKFVPGLAGDIQDVIMRLETGAITADEAKTALQELAGQNLNFSAQIGQLAALAGQLAAVRAEANAATAAMPGGPGSRGRPGKEPGQSVVNPDGSPIPPPRPSGLGDGGLVDGAIDLGDYELPTLPGGGSGGGGRGGGSSGRSGADRFADALESLRQRNEQLRQETALLATLNPLVNDYGYAQERAKAQAELLNAATEAGIALSPDQIEAINQLSESYAQATAESARLAEQQDAVREAFEDFKGVAKSVFSGFISDLRSGKSAAEALGNALGRLADQLIDMALNAAINSLFSSLSGMFFGAPAAPVSLGVPGFASGTANTGGARGQVRGVVHGQEAVIPLPNGGRVPVQIKGGGETSMRSVSFGDIHVSVPQSEMGDGADQAQAIARAVKNAVRMEIADNMRPGGLLNPRL